MFKSYIVFCLLSLCNASSNKTEDVSEMILALEEAVPESHSWSGGWCLASMAEAGWMRSAVLNPVMSLILQTELQTGILPLVTASNSGGSMFAIRYFTLRTYPSATKWSYPCYLLSLDFREVCYFHADFGTISDECFSENYNAKSLAAYIVYSPLMMMYGGPMGVVSLYSTTYYGFIADLPLNMGQTPWNQYVKQFVLWNTVFYLPSNWIVAHTLVSPLQARQVPYNYGWSSYLSRAVQAYKVKGQQWTISSHNITAAWMTIASANVPTGVVMIPFAFAGKSWDAMTGESVITPVMKLFSLMLSFVMVKKAISSYQVLIAKTDIYGECGAGCPIGDGAFTDDIPLIPAVAAAAEIAPSRPSWFLSTGSTSSVIGLKYLLGMSPMGMWQGGAVNVCPFTIAGICTMISELREILIKFLPQASYEAYYAIGSAYGVYRPELQLVTPYCSDPLTYDIFDGICEAEGLCDMWVSMIPSEINKVPFTPDPYTAVYVSADLRATPVSKRFVDAYLPESIWSIEYYTNMDTWFPNFDAISPKKGGVAFTSVAGNTFMDYMTYLNIRLVAFLFHTKQQARIFTSGKGLKCDYKTFKTVETFTPGQPEWLIEEASSAAR